MKRLGRVFFSTLLKGEELRKGRGGNRNVLLDVIKEPQVFFSEGEKNLVAKLREKKGRFV